MFCAKGGSEVQLQTFLARLPMFADVYEYITQTHYLCMYSCKYRDCSESAIKTFIDYTITAQFS